MSDQKSDLKSILKGLSVNERASLTYALENGIPRWVSYAPGKFVGVNVAPTGKILKVEETLGCYSIGSVGEAVCGS